MKLYDLIIREFSGDEWMTKLAECLNGNPVENGVSEETFRETFMKSVGYDPTTVYDIDRINKYYDENKHRFDLSDEDDVKVKLDIQSDYIARKDETVGTFVENYLTTNYFSEYGDDVLNCDDDDEDDDDFAEDEDDDYDDIVDDDDE